MLPIVKENCKHYKNAGKCTLFKKETEIDFPCDAVCTDFENIVKNENTKVNVQEKVNHPVHYGGEDNPYEAIKIIEAWKLNFNLGNAVKYLSRAGKKGDYIEDLEKASFYIRREIENSRGKI